MKSSCCFLFLGDGNITDRFELPNDNDDGAEEKEDIVSDFNYKRTHRGNTRGRNNR